MLTKVLNELRDGLGGAVREIVERNYPNTVCYDCRIDDFCHIEGCKLVNWILPEGESQADATTQENPNGSN